MAAIATLVQVDLFGAPARSLGRITAEVPRPARRDRKRPLAETTHAAGKARPETKRSRDQRRCLAAIIAAGAVGCTRQELADALHHPGVPGEEMPIQTVCWAIDALLKAGAVEEPVVDRDLKTGRLIHLTRDRKKVLRAVLMITAQEARAHV